MSWHSGSAGIGITGSLHQAGSHIILQTETPGHQRIPIPDHVALRIGTLSAILRLVEEHKSVTKDEVLSD